VNRDAPLGHKRFDVRRSLSQEEREFWSNVSLGAILCTAPMLFFTDWRGGGADVFKTLFLLLNTWVRLIYPSTYVPATHTRPGILGHPCFARVLATIAEFSFYCMEAKSVGLGFWSCDPAKEAFCLAAGGHFAQTWSVASMGPMGLLTALGETVCWSHILFQSEHLGYIEDCIWGLTQVYIIAFGGRTATGMIVALPFCVHCFLNHLPRQFPRLKDAKVFNLYEGSKLASQPDADTAAWQITSLLAKPVGYAFFQACLLHDAGKLSMYFGTAAL
jgi:hypothetical protein